MNEFTPSATNPEKESSESSPSLAPYSESSLQPLETVSGFDPLAGVEVQDHFIRSEDGIPPAAVLLSPSVRIQPNSQQRPFYLRNPISVIFSVILVLTYLFTSFPADFKASTNLSVVLGAFYPPFVMAGQWWRFITATMMHANPGHLLNNVAGLLIFGNLLEPAIGAPKMLTLYLLSAVTGLTLSALMAPNVWVLGASTVDYGLIGAYLTLVLLFRYQQDRTVFAREFRGTLLFVVMFTVWNWMESATISLWGHVGGLLGGILFAVLLWKIRPLKVQS